MNSILVWDWGNVPKFNRILSRYKSNLVLDYWKVAKKVIKYLLGIKDYMLNYRKSVTLKIVGYIDSDFAGYMDTIKSTFGYLLLLAKKVISWKKCKTVCNCGVLKEVEFVVCFEATIQGNWLRDFILGPWIVDSIANLLKIYYDNSAAVFFLQTTKYSKNAKHMELKYFSIK